MKYIKKLLEDPDNFTPPEYTRQKHSYEGKIWYVENLIELAKDLPVFEKPVEELRALALSVKYPGMTEGTYLDFAYHATVAANANLDYPIILAEDGRIMDGHHRVIKALMEKKKTIKVVQFTIDPEPDDFVE